MSESQAHPQVDAERIERYRKNSEEMFRRARDDCRETRARYLDLGMAWDVLATDLERRPRTA